MLRHRGSSQYRSCHVADNLSDVTLEENTAVNGSMGNRGINNRKSLCPLRAIKLQAIFFRRSYTHRASSTLLHPRLTLPLHLGTPSPAHPLFHLAPSRNYLPIYLPTYLPTHLPSSPPSYPLLFVLGIYLFASVSALLHIRRSPPRSLLSVFRSPLSPPLFLFSYCSLPASDTFFLTIARYGPHHVEDLPLITLTPFHNSIPSPYLQ